MNGLRSQLAEWVELANDDQKGNLEEATEGGFGGDVDPTQTAVKLYSQPGADKDAADQCLLTRIGNHTGSIVLYIK